MGRGGQQEERWGWGAGTARVLLGWEPDPPCSELLPGLLLTADSAPQQGKQALDKLPTVPSMPFH